MVRYFNIALVIMFFLAGCAEDMLSPTVEIVQPGNGDTVSGVVEILAEADDDLGVEKVEVYIDDTLRTEIMIEPFRYDWNTLVFPDNSTHRIQARAYDAADNEGVSSVVTVTVDNSVSFFALPVHRTRQ
jgi:thermitase